MKKSKRGSILRTIACMFSATIIVSVILSLVLSYTASYLEIKSEAAEHSNEAAQALNDIIQDRKELDESIKNAMPIRKTLQYLCRGYGLRYLYLFTIDEEKSEYCYLVTVSPDAAETEELMKVRGTGVTVQAEIPQGILEANSGSKSTKIFYTNNEFGSILGWAYPIDAEYDGRQVLIGAEYSIADIRQDVKRRTLIIIAPIILLLIGSSAALLLILRRRVIVPITNISARMRSFSDDYGKDEQKLEEDQNNEIGEIASSFNKMSDDIHRLISDNTALTEVKLQTEIQLDIARRIQCGIVPESMTLGGQGFSVCAFASAAKAVGGDFYDAFEPDKDRVCVVIGDVSGKGITAALFMTMTKTTIRELLKSGISPGEALNRANDEMCASNPEGMFATVFAAVLDLNTGELTYANAGHNPPVIIGESASLMNANTGIALGVFEDAGIEEEKLTLRAGECLLLYTDGVTEAVNDSNSFYGEERLLNACEGHRDSAEAVGAVKSSVLGHYGGRTQFDDLTLISLSYTGRTKRELALDPDVSETKRMLCFVKEQASGAAGIKKICLACDEAFANICSYSGAKSVTLSCEKSDSFTVTFTDDGKPFDPLAPREQKDFEELDEGGMGILLMKQSSDEISYRREDGKNVLTMDFRTE